MPTPQRVSAYLNDDSNFTNDAEIHLSLRGRVVRVIAATDNLGKGAAGQAVQNLNVMLGFPEESALDGRVVAI